MHHADELLEHLLGHGEIGNHAILHGADGLDVAGHLAQHGLGLAAHGLDGLLAVRAALVADGHDRGLVEHDALLAHVDQRVGRAQVYGQVGGEIPTNCSEHQFFLCASTPLRPCSKIRGWQTMKQMGGAAWRAGGYDAAAYLAGRLRNIHRFV